MPGVTRMSKANSRKSNNKKRIGRKLHNYATSQKRKDLRRKKTDFPKGTKQPAGEPQNTIPVLFHGHKIDGRMLTPLPRGDNKPVYERIKIKGDADPNEFKLAS